MINIKLSYTIIAGQAEYRLRSPIIIHRYLEHFKAVADTSSILKATNVLHISQPALSRSIKLLEEHIGVPLFRRMNKGVEITEYGKVLYRQVCSMGNEFEYALQEIEYIKKKKCHELKIGSGLVWQYGVFPKAFQFYRKDFSEVQIIAITGSSETLYHDFLNSHFDIIFCDISSLEPMTGVVYEPLMDICFTFYAASNHPIFVYRKIIEKDLEKYDLAVFSHNNQIESGYFKDEHQINANFRRKIKYISGSMVNVLEVVALSQYITSLPHSILRYAEQFGLREIDKKLRRASFPSGMIYRKSAAEKPHIKAFISAIRNAVNTSIFS